MQLLSDCFGMKIVRLAQIGGGCSDEGNRPVKQRICNSQGKKHQLESAPRITFISHAHAQQCSNLRFFSILWFIDAHPLWTKCAAQISVQHIGWRLVFFPNGVRITRPVPLSTTSRVHLRFECVSICVVLSTESCINQGSGTSLGASALARESPSRCCLQASPMAVLPRKLRADFQGFMLP